MPTEILMPALSPTMEEGKLAKWLVKEGDEVHSGDILAEIETDKATMEFEAVDEGRIAKLLVPEGAEGIKVNQPIATLVVEGETVEPSKAMIDIGSAMKSIKDAIGTVPSRPQQTEKRPALQSAPAKAAPAQPRPSQPAQIASGPQPAPRSVSAESGRRVFASPLARRIAQQRGIDIAGLRGSGPRGRVVRADVEKAKPGRPRSAQTGATARQAPGAPSTPVGIAPIPDARLFFKPDEFEEIPHDSMRKAIARRLTSAKTLIPHFYLTVECRIDNLLETRARLNTASDGAYKLSVNDFIVKAAALALLRVPEVNASWTDEAILRHKHADIGVAVALDFGLITPIVFRAEEKGLVVISNEVKALAERARTKKLKPAEFEGGTFAISNLGMFDIKSFTAVINPPHAGILAVGTGEARPIVHEGKIEPAMMMSVTMSCDHRVIDGATGARFLKSFKQFVEEPAAMLL